MTDATRNIIIELKVAKCGREAGENMSKQKTRKWLVKKRGKLTHKQVASLAGISRSFYTELETGIKNPGVATAQKIADALGFDWTLFFERKRCRTPQKGVLSVVKTQRSDANEMR